MITNSIRFKASVLYSSILCAILVGFSAYLFHAVKQILYQNAEAELQLKGEQITGIINAYGEVTNGQLPPMSLMRQFLSENDEVAVGKDVIDKLWEQHRWTLDQHQDVFRVVDIEGKVILRSDNLPGGGDRVFDRYLLNKSGASVFSNLYLSGSHFREMNYPFTFVHRTTLILQLAIPMDPVNRVLSRLLVFIIGGIIGILFFSIFIGSFLTRKILKPVADVTRTANNITQKNLTIRIPEQSLDDEMKVLVNSFNQMIERLERSFTHINEFSSHVAHELKTPLAIIKGELELAMAGENTREEDRRVMTVTLQETDRLIRIIKDLLLLAKFEYKLNIFKMEQFDLNEFLKDIYQHSKILAAEKDICLELLIPDQTLWVQGDTSHLRRLFFNLVHNSVKFTPKAGNIHIIVEYDREQVRVSIQDTGEGIAPEDQPRIFEKFYRIRRSDQTEVGGNGLGLCLARSIARGHGGDITFTSELNKGSTFTVTLPLIPTGAVRPHPATA